MSVIEQFLPGELPRQNNEHIFIRFMRKKYICVTMFLFTVTVIAQTIGLIISNIDKNILQHIDNTLSMPHNFTILTPNLNINGTIDALINP